MNWNPGVIIGVVILAIAVVGAAIPILKISLLARQAKRARREQQRQIERLKIRQLLADKKFFVSVKTKKDTNTDMETILIGYMVERGLNVFKSGPCEIEIVGVYDVYGVSDLTTEISYRLDVRATTVTGEIKAAWVIAGDSKEALAHNVLLYLSEALGPK